VIDMESTYEIVYVIAGRRYSETRDDRARRPRRHVAWVEGVVHGNGGVVLFVRGASS
jgi:hypothetical protein